MLIPLPSPLEIKTRFPLSTKASTFIRYAREKAKQILTDKDPCKVLIVGPCSIHDRLSALEYAERIVALIKEVERTCFILMRVYLEKPRTLKI